MTAPRRPLQLAAAIAVLVAAVLLVPIARRWDRRENLLFNVAAAIVRPNLVPFEKLVGGTVETRTRALDLCRATYELTASDSFPHFAIRTMVGRDIADASLDAGDPDASTRVAEFTVESTYTPGYEIPVKCSCPLLDSGSESSPRHRLPIVFHFFSGGLIVGSLRTELLLVRYIASRADAVVCSVGYRRAPEHRFPTAVEDGLDAAAALLLGDDNNNNPASRALGVGVDTSRFATFGFSAGGYMSAHVSRGLAHRHNLTASIQVSLVPMAKPYSGTESSIDYWDDPFWPGEANTFAWYAYLSGVEGADVDDGAALASDWRVSLLVDPPLETVGRLPMAFVQINSRDPLRDEGEMYANRLRAQGKLVELAEYDVTHIGVEPAMGRGGPGEKSMDHAIDVLIRHLSLSSSSPSSSSAS